MPLGAGARDGVAGRGSLAGGDAEKIFVRLAPDALQKAATLKLSAKQREILQLAAGSDGPLDPAKLAKAVGCTLAPIQLLRKRGLLVSESRRTATAAPHQADTARQPHLTLNADQRRASTRSWPLSNRARPRPSCCTA